MHYKNLHRYIDLYYDILASEVDFINYEFFWECRYLSLMMKNISDHQYSNLDDYFLSPTEYTIILNRCLSYEFEAVTVFKDDMRRKITELKQGKADNIKAYCRGDDINITIFIKEVCSRFYKNIIEGKISVEAGAFKSIHESNMNVQSMARYSNLHDKTLLDVDFERYSLARRGTSVNNRQQEKELLVEELKKLTKETNDYKSSSVKMLAFMQGIDIIFGEVRNHVGKQRQIVNTIKKDCMDENISQSFNDKLHYYDSKLLDNGSNILDKQSRTVNRTLASLNNEYYNNLIERKFDYTHHIKKLSNDLNERLCDEGYKYIYSSKDNGAQSVQKSLKCLYQNKNHVNLADYLLLDTTYKHILDKVNNNAKTEKLINKTSNQVVETINKILSKDGLNNVENILLSQMDQNVNINPLDRFKQAFDKEFNRLQGLNLETDMIRRMSKLDATQLQTHNHIFKPDDHNDDVQNKTASLTNNRFRDSELRESLNNQQETTVFKAIPDQMANFLSFQRNIDVDKIDHNAFQRKGIPITVDKSITDMNAECEDGSERHIEEDLIEPKTFKMIHSHIYVLKQKRMSKTFSDAHLNESKIIENQQAFQNSDDNRLIQSEFAIKDKLKDRLPTINDNLVDSDITNSQLSESQKKLKSGNYDSNFDGPFKNKVPDRQLTKQDDCVNSNDPVFDPIGEEDLDESDKKGSRRQTLAKMTGTGDYNNGDLIDSEYNDSDGSINESEVHNHGEEFIDKDIQLSNLNMMDDTQVIANSNAIKTNGVEIVKKPSFNKFTSFNEESKVEPLGSELLLSMEPIHVKKTLKDPYSRDTKMVDIMRPKLNSVTERSFADTNFREDTFVSSRMNSNKRSIDKDKKDIRELENIMYQSEPQINRSEVYNSLNSRLERVKPGKQSFIPPNRRITNIEVSYEEFKKTLESYIKHPPISEDRRETLLSSQIYMAMANDEITHILDANDKLDSGAEDKD